MQWAFDLDSPNLRKTKKDLEILSKRLWTILFKTQNKDALFGVSTDFSASSKL